ncbi:MAG: TIGR03545 family protein [Desulfobacterales bacterium]|nr:TIGR03545 family protein [Desulfobacterales bacterium]
MNRWIRWQGLVAFLGVTISICLIWALFVDPVIKRIIEKTGTKIVGAKVELEKADLSLFPIGLTLFGLQVTDPDEPMKNAVEIGRIAGTVDSLQLLRRKVIVDEMSVEGVRLGTQRIRSGAISKKTEKGGKDKKKEAVPGLTMMKLPDIQDLLGKENLQTLQLVQSIRTDIEGGKELWTKNIAGLPGKEKIDGYRKRIEALKGTKGSSKNIGDIGGILSSAGEAQTLYKDIQADLELLQKSQKGLNATLANFKDQIAKIEKAPQEDVRRLSEKYGFSAYGLANMSRFFIEPGITAWVDRGLYWKARLEPLVERAIEKKGNAEVIKPLRAKGSDVRFKEKEPLPDFLIRVAKVSVQLPMGDFSGAVKNITPDQNILGQPLLFAFSGEKLSGVRSVRLDGAINRVSPGSPEDSINLRLEGYKVQTKSISQDSSLPLTLEKGDADLELKAALSKGFIDATVAAKLQGVRFSAGGADAQSGFGKAVSSALSGVSTVVVKAMITGPTNNYQMQISSNLDDILKDAVGSIIKDQVAQFENKLRAAISDRVSGPLQEAKGSLGGFEGLGGEVESRISQLTGIQGGGVQKQSQLGGFQLPFKLPLQ